MRLINVLIVDDESFVVDWIASLIEAQKDIEAQIFRAYQASQAVDIANQARIDLLISDIRMPEMDGLALSKLVISRWSTCKVLLLTAHSDFEYAQRAIGTGVIGYILKNQKDDFILSEIKRAIVAINENLIDQKKLENAQKDRDAYRNLLEKNAFFYWLNGQYYSKESLIENIELLGFDKNNGSYCILIAKIDSQTSINNSQSKDIYHAKTNILYYIKNSILQYAVETSNNLLVWIIQPLQENKPHFISWMQGILEIVQQTFWKSYHLSISFVLSTLTEDPSELSEKYLMGKSLSKTIAKEGYIHTYSNLDSHHEMHKKIISNHKNKQYISLMKKYLNDELRDEYIENFDLIFNVIKKENNFNSLIINEQYYSIALILVNYINQNNFSSEFNERYNMLKLFHPQSYSNWENAFLYLRELSLTLFDLKDDEKKQSALDMINIVEEYIKSNIAEDISLATLSDIVGYNSSYLSRIYSEKTGSTISNFIAEQKMKFVISLMKDKALSINEIIEKSGFHSRTYFNYFVKHHTGMTPAKYRNTI